jgi:multidrug efflux pump
MVQLPAGATQTRTQQVLDQVQDYYLNKEKANVESVFTVNGFSFSGQGQNSGIAFISLKPWEERPGRKMALKPLWVARQKRSVRLKMASYSRLTCLQLLS